MLLIDSGPSMTSALKTWFGLGGRRCRTGSVPEPVPVQPKGPGRSRRRRCGWRGPRSRGGAWRSGSGTSWAAVRRRAVRGHTTGPHPHQPRHPLRPARGGPLALSVARPRPVRTLALVRSVRSALSCAYAQPGGRVRGRGPCGRPLAARGSQPRAPAAPGPAHGDVSKPSHQRGRPLPPRPGAHGDAPASCSHRGARWEHETGASGDAAGAAWLTSVSARGRTPVSRWRGRCAGRSGRCGSRRPGRGRRGRTGRRRWDGPDRGSRRRAGRRPACRR